MSTRFRKWESSEGEVTRSDILEMRSLLQIVDEILWADHYIDDDKLPTPESSTLEPVCSGCGGEVFQTAFCCAEDCHTNSALNAPTGNLIIICPLCYVEGRTCYCAKMRPVRFREMDPLLQVRNSVHEFVRSGGGEELLLSDDGGEAPADFYER